MSGDSDFGYFCADQNVVTEANLALYIFPGVSKCLLVPMPVATHGDCDQLQSQLISASKPVVNRFFCGCFSPQFRRTHNLSQVGKSLSSRPGLSMLNK